MHCTKWCSKYRVRNSCSVRRKRKRKFLAGRKMYIDIYVTGVCEYSKFKHESNTQDLTFYFLVILGYGRIWACAYGEFRKYCNLSLLLVYKVALSANRCGRWIKRASFIITLTFQFSSSPFKSNKIFVISFDISSSHFFEYPNLKGSPCIEKKILFAHPYSQAPFSSKICRKSP